MTPRRGNWPIAALLLALMLPLQSFTAAFGCEHANIAGQATQSTQHVGTTPHEHCAQHPVHGSTVQSHGCCAACCMTAVVAATLDWTPPRAVASEPSLPGPSAPLLIPPDRLDRPP